jgi:putative endonuclease
MNKRKTGAFYEEAAAEYLKMAGCRILERNFRSRTGEIDIICKDPAGTICFVEVKYRQSERYGHPEEAVGPAKQRTICRTARYYLLCSRLWRLAEEGRIRIRFDVIAISGDPAEKRESIRWFKDAFPYQA